MYAMRFEQREIGFRPQRCLVGLTFPAHPGAASGRECNMPSVPLVPLESIHVRNCRNLKALTEVAGRR
jgi:hypothetical protein